MFDGYMQMKSKPFDVPYDTRDYEVAFINGMPNWDINPSDSSLPNGYYRATFVLKTRTIKYHRKTKVPYILEKYELKKLS